MDLKSLPQPIASLVQRGLASLGLYDGTYLGLPGHKTQAAYEEYLESLRSVQPVTTGGGLVESLVEIAVGEVGVREKGGNNKGPRVQEYQAATSIPGTGWPWCAAFICWCVREAVRVAGPVTWELPKTALAYGFSGWAKGQGLDLKYRPAAKDLEAGDIISFRNFSHVALVEKKPTGKFVHTIEGNTDAKGSRDGKTHGGVWRKRRAISGIRDRVRLQCITS